MLELIKKCFFTAMTNFGCSLLSVNFSKCGFNE